MALKQGIPFGQFLRLWQNCTDTKEFKHQAKDLSGHFRAKGYPVSVLKKAYNRAHDTNRTELLVPK